MDILSRSHLKVQNGLSFFQSPAFTKFEWIRHAFLTRRGGISLPPFDSLNLGGKKGDREKNVLENRERIAEAFGFEPSRLVLLDQMQKDEILLLKEPVLTFPSPLEFDALITNSRGIYLGVLTADCLPILVADGEKKVIAAIHAGRHGTALHITAKVIKKMKEEFGSSPGDLLVGLGPSVGICCYEIDDKTFRPEWKPFSRSREGSKWMVDLAQINIAQMKEEGVEEEHISSISLCTRCCADLFFSYRREGRTGRQLSFIGII